MPESNFSYHSSSPHGRILVIDESGFNRVVLDRCLTSAGYKVIQAADGYIALQLLKNQPFDLVITDLAIPGLSGMELLIKIRAASAGNHSVTSSCPPFFLCTSKLEKDTIQTAILNGFSEIVIRPINQEKLLELVQKHLRPPQEEEDDLSEPVIETETGPLQKLAENMGAGLEAIRNTIIDEVLRWKPLLEMKSLEELQQKLREALGIDQAK